MPSEFRKFAENADHGVGLKRYPPTCLNCTENKSDDLFEQNISEISEETGKTGHFLLFKGFMAI